MNLLDVWVQSEKLDSQEKKEENERNEPKQEEKEKELKEEKEEQEQEQEGASELRPAVKPVPTTKLVAAGRRKQRPLEICPRPHAGHWNS